MNGTELNPLLTWFTTYKYLVILPFTVIQGPTAMLVGGFLLKLGYFSALPLYLVLMAGDLIGDFMWYGIGYFAARPFFERHGRFLSVSREMILKLEKLFQKYQNKILFISKITMGFGFALLTLVSAGMSRVPLKKYAFFNIIGGFVWTAFLMSVGYFFGNIYLVIDKGFRLAFVILLIGLTLAGLYGFSRAMRKRFLKNNHTNHI